MRQVYLQHAREQDEEDEEGPDREKEEPAPPAPAQEDLKAQITELKALITQGTGRIKNKRPFNGECWNCGKRGHYKHECKAPPKSNGEEANK